MKEVVCVELKWLEIPLCVGVGSSVGGDRDFLWGRRAASAAAAVCRLQQQKRDKSCTLYLLAWPPIDGVGEASDWASRVAFLFYG